MNIKLPVIVCSCALVAGCATDRMRGTSKRSTRTAGSAARFSLSSEDQRFVLEAARSGLAEVQMGQLAQQKGQSENVRNFGQMLVTDHQTANQELMAIATRNGFQVPTQIGPAEKDIISRLSSVSGAEFDRMAAQENVKAHQKVIQQFQTAQQTVQDAELKAFIGKTLPVLQSHLQHAETLQSGTVNAGAAESLESRPTESSGVGASNQGQDSAAEQPNSASPTPTQQPE